MNLVNYRNSGGLKSFKVADASGPLTSFSLATTSTSTHTLHLVALYVSSSIAMSFRVLDTSSNVLIPNIYFGANGGAALEDVWEPVATGGGMKITTAGSAVMSVFGYYLERK